MLKRLFLIQFLFFFSSLISDESSPYELAVFMGEPNSIVAGCVSAITGDFFINEEDFIVRGSQPISIKRRYYSRAVFGPSGGWKLNLGRLKLSALGVDLAFYVPEKNGVNLIYSFSQEEQVYKPPCDHGGLTNCSSGEIGARLNILNNKAYFKQGDHKKDHKEIIVEGADNSFRHYRSYLSAGHFLNPS